MLGFDDLGDFRAAGAPFYVWMVRYTSLTHPTAS